MAGRPGLIMDRPLNGSLPLLDSVGTDRQAGSMVEPPQIPLANAIRAIRAEVVDAVRASDGEELRFALGVVELELQVEAVSEAGGEAGVKFWVVSAGAKGNRKSGSTHTLRVSLTPIRVGAHGDVTTDVLVASELEER